jgi:hypothetical protein
MKNKKNNKNIIHSETLVKQFNYGYNKAIKDVEKMIDKRIICMQFGEWWMNLKQFKQRLKELEKK